jgi:hypothetical protein
VVEFFDSSVKTFPFLETDNWAVSSGGQSPIIGRIRSWPRIYRTLGRRILFRSIASAAAIFRLKCGSRRRPPARSRQQRPIGTPQIGQGTEDNCFLVSAAILIRIRLRQKPP